MRAMDAEMATGGRLSGLAVTTLEEHGSRHTITSRARPGTRHVSTHGTFEACQHTYRHCSRDILTGSPKRDLRHVQLADHPTDGDGPTVGHNATKPLHQPTSPTWVVCTRARQRASGEEADAEGSDQTARSAQREQGRARSEGRLIGNNGTSTTRREEYDGMGSSDGVDGDGIGGLHCAAKPQRGAASCVPRGGFCLSLGQRCLALVYIGWVFAAYVTFADDLENWPRCGRRRSTRPSARVRRRARQRTRRSASRLSDERLVSSIMAVAPPKVGRSRLRRNWVGHGTWYVLRLGSRIVRCKRHDGLAYAATSRRVSTPSLPRTRAAPRCWIAPCRTCPASPPGHGNRDIRGEDAGLTAAEACKVTMGSLRVGEAGNPGPAAPLLWVSSMAAAVLRYAMPGKTGFHGTHTAGFDVPDAAPQPEPFVLRVATANTTGWRPLQRFVLTTEANVVFAQEHRLLPEAIPAASAWARKQGWKTVWAPARLGQGGGASAGTVVMARAYMGLRHPECGSAIVAEGHAVAAVVEPPASRPFMGYAAYFHNGQGLSRTNLELAAAIGSHWEAQGDGSLQLMIGADFNMEPEVFARSGLSRRIWGRVVVPPTRRGTCRTRSKAATYDFFYMTAALAELVSDVRTVEGTGIKTHAPTLATFHPRLAALKALMLRAPPNLPTEEVYGPRPPPPPQWDGIKKAVNDLVCFARDGGGFEQVEQLLSDLYSIWMDTAEGELADITGTALPKLGCRGRGPKMAWRSILPENSRAPPPSGASALAWLMDIARDATRIHRPPADTDDVTTEELIDVLLTALDDAIDGRDQLETDGSVGAMRNLLVEANSMCSGGVERRDARWVAWASKLEELLDQFRTRHSRCAAAETSDKLRGWREWLREGFEAGAKHAHAYLRLPEEWRPSTATTPHGLPTADPAAVLEGQRAKYARAWADDGDSGWYQCTDREALPRLTPSDLRAASRQFKKSTAIAYDGVHVRHYAMLSDGALEALGGLLEVCELVGTFPRQARLVVTPLLEKPRGGFRPIAIYVSLYRVWAKARRHVAAEWEAAHPRSYFSAARGNGPQDTTWRQGVRQEAQVCAGGAAACLYWDLESFFECVDRETLLKRAEAAGFPKPVIRLAMAMYAAPRLLSMGGRLAREVWPKRGVGAGCGLANTFVKIFTMKPLDDLAAKLPPTVTIDLHVDDFAIESVARDERTAARDLIIAQKMVRDMIENELGAVVSVPKAALVASSSSLASTIRDAVGTLAGPVRMATPNLGMDAAAARRRAAKGTNPLRRARWCKAVKRKRRLRALASVVGPKAGRIFTVGIGASATYHAAVQGLTDVELAKLRRLAAVAYPPRSRFRSLTLTHLLHDMPTAAAEVAAALQFSRAVWQATLLGGSPPRHEGFDLPGLRAAWEKVAEGIDEYLDADHPDPRKRRRWGRSRGPLSAAMLELHRIGWTPASPFEWTNDLGVKVVLTETPPAMLKQSLKESVRRQAERTMGAKRAAKDPRFAGRRMCIDAAADALRRDRTLTPMQKGAFRSVLLGGVLTRSRAAELGYDVDDECELCGHKGDDIFHRTFRCSGTEQLVRQAIPEWFWREAQDADEGDPFWTTAAVPHPADLFPPPRPDYLSWALDADGCRCEDPRMEGHVFIDGSCSTSVFRGLQRAALALVQLDNDMKAVKTVSIPLWDSLPQTSQAAEYAAYAALAQILDGKTTAYGDCQGVLEQAAKPPAERYAGKRKYAGVLRSMLKHPQGMGHIAEAVKVKAHQRIENISDERERWMAVGNNLADEAAKAARERHPQPPKELADLIRFWEVRASLVVRAVATAMVNFSPMGGKLKKKEGAHVPAPSAVPGDRPPVHKWEFMAGRWRCSQCWTYILGAGGVPASRRREVCQPGRVPVRQLEFQERGHAMMHTEGDLPITFCARCGGWSSRRANRLSRRCGPPTAAGKMALRRIEAGLHPWQARDASTGKDLPRTRLTIKRARDATQTTATIVNSTYDQRGPVGVPSAASTCERAGARAKRRRVDTECRDDDDDHIIDAPPGDVQEGAMDDEFASEEDVFGHGGDLDQEGPPRAPCELTAREGDNNSAGDWQAVDRDTLQEETQSEVGTLGGTSMPMLISTVKHAPRQHHLDHIVPIFNSATGCIVRASLRSIVGEIERLRDLGVSDDGLLGNQAQDARPTPPRAPSGEIHAPTATDLTVSSNVAREEVKFASRAELIRHLSSTGKKRGRCEDGSGTNERRSTIASAEATAEQQRKEPRYNVDKEFARAASTTPSAVDAREGLGGPVHEAGATAAAALPPVAVVAAAVTAKCTVVQLRSGTLTTMGPPDGCAAPSDGKGSAGFTRPDRTTPMGRPNRLGRGRANCMGAYCTNNSVEGPPMEIREEDGRRRRPPRDASAARSSADAAGPSGGKGPLKGSPPSAPGARNEFGDEGTNGDEDGDAWMSDGCTVTDTPTRRGSGDGGEKREVTRKEAGDEGRSKMICDDVPMVSDADASAGGRCGQHGRTVADATGGGPEEVPLLPAVDLPRDGRGCGRGARPQEHEFPRDVLPRQRLRVRARGLPEPRGQVSRAAGRADERRCLQGHGVPPRAAGGKRVRDDDKTEVSQGPKRAIGRCQAALTEDAEVAEPTSCDGPAEQEETPTPRHCAYEDARLVGPEDRQEEGGTLVHAAGASVQNADRGHKGSVVTGAAAAAHGEADDSFVRARRRIRGKTRSILDSARHEERERHGARGGVPRRISSSSSTSVSAMTPRATGTSTLASAVDRFVRSTPSAADSSGDGRSGCNAGAQVDGEMNTLKCTLVKSEGQEAAGAVATGSCASTAAGRPLSSARPEG